MALSMMFFKFCSMAIDRRLGERDSLTQINGTIFSRTRPFLGPVKLCINYTSCTRILTNTLRIFELLMVVTFQINFLLLQILKV